MENRTQVYLVDDGADYRFLVEQVFTRFLPQYTVRFFESGDRLCLFILETEAKSNSDGDGSSELGLILLDMHMPGRSGLQTLQEIRRHPHWQRIPVIMMSNGSSQQDMDACYDAGANSFLTKPMEVVQLRKTLETVCYYWLQVNRLPNGIN